MTLWNRVWPYARSFAFLAALWFSDRFFGFWAPICITVGVIACMIIWQIGKGE